MEDDGSSGKRGSGRETASGRAGILRKLVARGSALPVGAKFMAQKANVLKEKLVPARVSSAYSKGVYRTPVGMGAVTAFGSRCISPAHQLGIRNAVDFYVPEGTPVRAPADGVISAVAEKSRSRGISTRYWLKGNGLCIRCANGERVWMEHMRHGFATELGIRVGQAVKACDRVGTSGNTGFTENPHVHMEVLKPGGGYVALKIRFDRRDIPFDLYRGTIGKL